MFRPQGVLMSSAVHLVSATSGDVVGVRQRTDLWSGTQSQGALVFSVKRVLPGDCKPLR